MITKVFSVYDTKAEAYVSPFFFPAVGLAIRGFVDEANNPNSQINKHPTDFALFELGEFDDSSGVFTCLPAPRNLGLAHEFLAVGQDS